MEEQLYYKDALKLAQKDYRACISKGISPCLPVLDDFVSASNVANAVDLGVVQIPADMIVGTKTRGRMNAFSTSFMPLLEDGTDIMTIKEALGHKSLASTEVYLTLGIGNGRSVKSPMTSAEPPYPIRDAFILFLPRVRKETSFSLRGAEKGRVCHYALQDRCPWVQRQLP